MTWDNAKITMRTYPDENKTETIAKQWFLDRVDNTPNKMNDDGLYPLSNISATIEDITKKTTQRFTNGG